MVSFRLGGIQLPLLSPQITNSSWSATAKASSPLQVGLLKPSVILPGTTESVLIDRRDCLKGVSLLSRAPTQHRWLPTPSRSVAIPPTDPSSSSAHRSQPAA